MRAIWKGTTIAESDDIVEVEGNAYFPHDALRPEHFKPSDTHTTCPWKGRASYYDVVVGEDVNADAAWYYPSPKAGAESASRVSVRRLSASFRSAALNRVKSSGLMNCGTEHSVPAK